MKTSNPPSYDKIFNIKYAGTDTVARGATIPEHRGLLIIATATNTTFSFTNIDGTTTTMTFVSGSIVLPLQIKSYTYTGNQGALTNVSIYGLV